ncbi:MAG TPA: CPBP family glutamic-type intramembrane protease [Terriglobales bacterium]
MVKQAMTLIYSIGIFVARWSLQLAGIHSVHRHVEDASIAPWLVTAMFTPALGVLLLMAFSKAARENVMWWLDWRALGFAPYCILIPTLVAFAEIAIFTWRGWGRSAWFGFSTAGVQVSGGRWLLGGGEQNWPVFISNVILTATVYSLVGMVFGAAEELRWRGYLQEQLIQRFGLSMGIICLGLLWSLWHLPLLLAGYNYPENPLLGALLLSPILLVAALFVLAWLTLRTRSFWPAEFGPGRVSVVCDADRPHIPSGCIAQAWSVAQLLSSVANLRPIATKKSLAVTG